MEIKTYLSIVAKRWWIILLVILAVGIASIYVSGIIPPKYEASTSLRVVTPLGGSLGDISYQTYYADRLMNTYAQIATSEQVMQEVKSKLGLKKLPDVTVKTIPSSEIIVITVDGNDPDLVANTANTIAEIITFRSQASANQIDPSSEELKILDTRKTEIADEVNQAKQDHAKLVLLNAQTTAQMQILDRTIRMKESTYQNLEGQHQQAVINQAIAVYHSTRVPAQQTEKILQGEMTSVDSELAAMRKQYQDLATRSATYTQQIIAAGQTIQNKANAYENLLSQIDSAKIANSKRESAQDVMVASAAVPPLKPTGPTSALIISLGFLFGIIGGILAAFLVNTLDTRIRTSEQIQRLTGKPILGRLPSLSHKDLKAPWKSDDIAIQRALGTLCTKILAVQRNNPVKTILITSPNPREGKSLIAMALAEEMAKSNKTVLVVDADWRKSGLLKHLNASPDQCGLSRILRGECQLSDAVQVFSNPRVHYLLSGFENEDPTSFVNGPAFPELLKKMDSYDLVLFDTPAMLAVPDAYNLALKMDGIIFVVQHMRTTVEDVEVMLSQLDDVQSKIMGTIANRVPTKKASGYYQRKSVPVQSGYSKPA